MVAVNFFEFFLAAAFAILLAGFGPVFALLVGFYVKQPILWIILCLYILQFQIFYCSTNLYQH